MNPFNFEEALHGMHTFREVILMEPDGTRWNLSGTHAQIGLGFRPQAIFLKMHFLGTRWNPSRIPLKFKEALHGMTTFVWRPAFYLYC